MEIVIKKYEELTLNELYEILKVRVNVFVVEQKCPYPELDDKDKKAYHAWLWENGTIKAYLRVLPAGVSYEEPSIGRVLTTERGKGYGEKIFAKGIEIAREKLNAHKLRIGAQLYAKGFYERFGFKQVSEKYLEDGIYHIEMLWEN